MNARILLVEDDQSLALGLSYNLRAAGYDVTVLSDAESAEGVLKAGAAFDLYILDWMLPGKDGVELLRNLRRNGVEEPVLLLTARDSEDDVVAGLDSGADDYLAKPFDLNVLLARARSLLRRRGPGGGHSPVPDEARIANARVDFNALTAEVGGETRRLTYKEAEILKLLWERRNQVVTREEILHKIWGVEGYIQSRTVDNHVVQLRKLLEENPKKPRVILSIHGSGYKLIG